MTNTARTILAVVIAALVVALAAPYWPAAALIIRAAGATGWLGAVARLDARPVSDTLEQIPVRDGVIRARIFRPSGTASSSALVVGGVHPQAIDDPRMIELARELAATGITVVTPEIADLMSYQVTPQVTDTIEDAALWMVKRPDLFGTTPIGLIGVSFSGGLSIVAAGRPSLRRDVAYVVSLGGHGNLPRVLRYLCTGIEPSIAEERGAYRAPHDYGLAILLHQAADLIVPPEQLDPLHRSIETFLHASAASRTEREHADDLFAAARAQQRALPEPSATLMKYVNERNVEALGERLLPYLDRLGQHPSLSPDRSPPPAAPVFLLHGTDDNVIPAAETVLLSRHLESHTRVRALLSDSLTHVDLASQPTMRDVWELVAFWADILGEQ